MNLNIALPEGEISLTPDGVFCPEHGMFPFDEYGCPECRIEEADAIGAGAHYCEQHVRATPTLEGGCTECWYIQQFEYYDSRGMCAVCSLESESGEDVPIDACECGGGWEN